MAYITMKKLITNENNKLANGTITVEEYEIWKVSTQNKLDVFYGCNRLTTEQYEELVAMMQTEEV